MHVFKDRAETKLYNSTTHYSKLRYNGFYVIWQRWHFLHLCELCSKDEKLSNREKWFCSQKNTPEKQKSTIREYLVIIPNQRAKAYKKILYIFIFIFYISLSVGHIEPSWMDSNKILPSTKWFRSFLVSSLQAMPHLTVQKTNEKKRSDKRISTCQWWSRFPFNALNCWFT